MLILNILSFACLLFALFFAVKMTNKTKRISPAWLLFALTVIFLVAYTITNIIECITPVHLLGHTMEHIEFVIVATAGILFATACLVFKNSLNKPI